MKRIVSLILVLSLLFIPIYSNAANEIYVGINNAMLPLDNAMPFSSGGVWYIDYMDFTRGDLGISASYNKDLGTAVLYNWDVTLVFNVGKGTAYKEGGTQVSQRSFFRNGTVYVPAAFVAEQFGITFSYISEVSTLRFRSTSSMSDAMFTYIAKNRIPDLLAAYKKSISETSPAPSTTPDGSDKTNNKNNTVYITVNASSDDGLKEISTLINSYNLPATFFISKDAMGDDNLIRKLSSGRHSVGIYATSTADAAFANDLLYTIAKKKSRLLRSDSPLTDAETNGYRQWGANVNANARSANQINNLLTTRGITVLQFDESETSINRLKSVLAFISSEKLTARTIDIMSTPVAP